MALTGIRELYVVNLSELYEAEEEILRQLPLMAAQASDPELKALLDDHYRETQRHITRLQAIFDALDERRRPMRPFAIRGLVEEARGRQALLDRGELLDVTLIDAGRRMEHYELAAYSSTLGYARRLGYTDAAALLLETLDEVQRTDDRLERLASPARASAA